MEMKSKVGSCSTTSTSRDEGDSNNSGSKDYMDVVVDDCIIMDDEYEGSLPGFRFHPTDQELVSFYLKRKVDKRPLSIQIIKDMDIYKHDPWDLAKSRSVGDKEWYFYCKRGRKYRNSVRPNRVTGSGFWKATGIDRPIYSNGGEGQHCVGLKKSLVYYRGCAGKGTKTDWMMHEFRLPTNLPPPPPPTHHPNSSNPTSLFEAEIWTLCRIFKRNKRQTPDWKELSSRKNAVNSSSKPSSVHPNPNYECYISFATHPSTVATNIVYAPISTKAKHDEDDDNDNIVNKVDQKSAYLEDEYHQAQWNNNYITHSSSTPAASNSSSLNIAEEYENELGLFGRTNWDDLSSVVEFAVRTPLM